jgi:hypothetical protein
MKAKGISWLVVVLWTGFAWAASCSAPQGFVDTPHPAIAPAKQMASHTEKITIDRPLPVVLQALFLQEQEKTPGAGSSSEFMLTSGGFGAPGSRRLTCLGDGSTAVEEVLERQQSSGLYHFRYVVWNYTSPKSRPVDYGVADFRYTDAGADRTQVVWTYSFKLRDDDFPGSLGAAGDYVFRTSYLDKQYAYGMRGVLAGYKADAERLPADSHN